jgi:glycosyltransferase involved in cell wall biosynthesis
VTFRPSAPPATPSTSVWNWYDQATLIACEEGSSPQHGEDAPSAHTRVSAVSTPRVSVILPTWNRARFLAEAIDSVLAQTFGDLELLVVDDGSTDDTARLLAAVEDPRLRVIRQEHRGGSAALNAGLREARGEFIARIDSDDSWLPDMLEAEAAVLDARPEIDVVYAQAEAMDPAGNVIPGQVRGRPERFPGEPLRSMLYEDFTCNIAILARRRCYARIGEYDESLSTSEDWDLWMRVARCCRFAYLDRVVARFRIHEGNTIGPGSPFFGDFVTGRTRVLDKMFAEPALDPSLSAMRAVSYRNVYIWAGFLSYRSGRRRRAMGAFAQALGAGANPFDTLARITWLALSQGVLSRCEWGRRLVEENARLRRRWRERLARRRPTDPL